MFINPMNPIDSINQLNTLENKNQKNKTNDFRNIFNEAINNVKETESTLENEQYLFATGQSQDTHSLGIAATKAQISVELLVTLRNKALESYNEIMRTSV